MLTLVLLVGGLALLITGAELLVRGASRLALAVGISPLVVGLTVVSLGTSSPEIAVSVDSALKGEGDLTLGNVVGSNICNVLLILGASALVVPLVVSRRLIRIHVPLMVGVSILLILLALNGSLGRVEGIVLCAALVAYIAFTVYEGRRETTDALPPAVEAGSESRLLSVAMLFVGLGMLIIGAQLLVNSATEIAEDLGLSTLVIGLTLVALGTSLPEIATSLIAALRGERDLAVGNVVGSNVFNILGVMGISSLVSPEPLTISTAAVRFDLPIMLAVAIACLPIFFTGRLIARWEGAVFVAYYCAYLLYVVLRATEHDALGAYSAVMLLFVLPLTVLTLGTGALYELQRVRIRWMLRRYRRRASRPDA